MLCSVTITSPGALLCSNDERRPTSTLRTIVSPSWQMHWVPNGLDYHVYCLIKLDLASRGYVASQ